MPKTVDEAIDILFSDYNSRVYRRASEFFSIDKQIGRIRKIVQGLKPVSEHKFISQTTSQEQVMKAERIGIVHFNDLDVRRGGPTGYLANLKLGFELINYKNVDFCIPNAVSYTHLTLPTN